MLLGSTSPKHWIPKIIIVEKETRENSKWTNITWPSNCFSFLIPEQISSGQWLLFFVQTNFLWQTKSPHGGKWQALCKIFGDSDMQLLYQASCAGDPIPWPQWNSTPRTSLLSLGYCQKSPGNYFSCYTFHTSSRYNRQAESWVQYNLISYGQFNLCWRWVVICKTLQQCYCYWLTLGSISKI